MSESNVKEMRIIVAGGRGFNDYSLLSEKLMDYLEDMDNKDVIDNHNQVKFISGTARRADVLGEQFAYNYGYDVIRFPAKWDELGKRAGYVRNAEMAKYAAEKCGVLFAFWDGKSKGTKNMIDLAKRYGLEVHVTNYD